MKRMKDHEELRSKSFMALHVLHGEFVLESRRMSKRLIIAICVLVGASIAAAQTPADQKQILDLAKAGRADEAWKAWDALPRSPETLRLGITLAVETKRMTRGIEVYEALAVKAPDTKALSTLALSAAAELADSPDLEARLAACGAALRLDPKQAACRRAVDAVAQSKTSLDEQTLAVYTLANVGLRPWPGLFSTLEAGMNKTMRLRIALGMTRLPAAERFALVRPLLDDPDVTTRYQLVILLADIPGKDVLGTLRNLQAAPPPASRMGDLPGLDPLKNVLPLALARHGDDAGLEVARKLLPHLAGVEKLMAARALADAKDQRGVVALQQLAASQLDVERLDAAKALAPYDAATAKRIVGGTLAGGSPAIRERALHIAGALKMGTEPVVYKKLVDGSPTVRAAAIAAVLETVAPRPGGLQPNPPNVP